MKLKSLLSIAASIPTLAFAQNNYQTQYLTGTYLDQAYQYNITSGTEQRLQQAQTQINWLEDDKSRVENIQGKTTPNTPSQNFNEPTPRTGK